MVIHIEFQLVPLSAIDHEVELWGNGVLQLKSRGSGSLYDSGHEIANNNTKLNIIFFYYPVRISPSDLPLMRTLSTTLQRQRKASFLAFPYACL